MEIILAIITGVLYASGVYMIMRRSMVKLILGIILLGNGVNLLIFLLGRITKGEPPIIDSTKKVLEGVYADPVPQALILTAIVVSFGSFSLLLAMVNIASRRYDTVDSDHLTNLTK